MAKERKQQSSGISKRDAETRKAEAEAKGKVAEAEARAAEAKAKVEQSKIDADAARDERKANESGKNTAIQVGLNVSAIGAGMYLGKKLSKGIEARHQATLIARNTQINALGAQTRRLLNGSTLKVTRDAKLKGVVASADKLKLGKFKGPLGLLTGGLLIAEALYARKVANDIESETGRAAGNALATGSVLAATNLVGSRIISNATPSALPSANALAAIETARVSIKPTTAQVLSKFAKKALLPIVATAAAIAAMKQSAQAGESTAKTVGDGVKAAADVVTFDSVSGYDAARKDGDTVLGALVRGAIKGFGDTIAAPFSLLPETSRIPKSGAAYLNSGAASKAQTSMPMQPAAAPSSAAAQPSSDGTTNAYSRRSKTGLVVQVGGYKTPTR